MFSYLFSVLLFLSLYSFFFSPPLFFPSFSSFLETEWYLHMTVSSSECSLFFQRIQTLIRLKKLSSTGTDYFQLCVTKHHKHTVELNDDDESEANNEGDNDDGGDDNDDGGDEKDVKEDKEGKEDKNEKEGKKDIDSEDELSIPTKKKKKIITVPMLWALWANKHADDLLPDQISHLNETNSGKLKAHFKKRRIALERRRKISHYENQAQEESEHMERVLNNNASDNDNNVVNSNVAAGDAAGDADADSDADADLDVNENYKSVVVVVNEKLIEEDNENNDKDDAQDDIDIKDKYRFTSVRLSPDALLFSLQKAMNGRSKHHRPVEFTYTTSNNHTFLLQDSIDMKKALDDSLKGTDSRRTHHLKVTLADVGFFLVHNSTSDVSILHGLHMLHELLEIHGTSCNGIYLSATKTVLNQSPLLQTLSYLLTNSNAKPRIGIRIVRKKSF